MIRRLPVVLPLVLLVSALPLAASQFIRAPFDEVARGSALIVRGTLSTVTSEWDAHHEVIFSRATLQVTDYLGGFGPQTLVVREVGGTVDGYTQEAIGFPVLREGEEVVLFLSVWEDGASDYRIHAFNQGKYLVHKVRGIDTVAPDPVHQGEARPGETRMRMQGESLDDTLSLDELRGMVRAARQAAGTGIRNR